MFTEPLAYGEFTRKISVARILRTDSGGVQEETPSLGNSASVLRSNTARPGTAVAGIGKAFGSNEESIDQEVTT